MLRIICILFGYLFGNFQTSYIIGKIKGIDIRTRGSGNLGTTNSFRVFGKSLGILTLIFDILKSILAVIIGQFIIKALGLNVIDKHLLYSFYIGLGVILGHDFPIFLKFKGGKGVASSAGLILALGYIPLFFILLSIFLIFFLSTGYVSLGSILAYIAFAISVIVFGHMGIYTSQPFLMNKDFLIEIYIIAIFIAMLGIFKHRMNIKRLLNGNENRFNVLKRRK